MTTIDLNRYRSPGIGVLAGRERAEMIRASLELDKLDREGGVARVLVPDSIISVNSSFFLGLFGNSVRTLGESEFRRRYVFAGENAERVREDGIRFAVLTESPLREAAEEVSR
jgi:hypothetical protein